MLVRQCVRQPAAPVHRVRSRARHLGSCRSIARARRRDVAPSGAARPGASARWRVPRRPSPVSTTRSSISRAPALGDRKPRPTCFAVGARRANRSASPQEADHVRTSVTSTASTGPSGASSRYCGYFSLSKASERALPLGTVVEHARTAADADPPEPTPLLGVMVDEEGHVGPHAGVFDSAQSSRALGFPVDRRV